MAKKEQTGKPVQQKKDTLTAGRIIKIRLPTETDKPNPFLADLRKPETQKPEASGSGQGKPTLTGQDDSSKPSSSQKPD